MDDEKEEDKWEGDRWRNVDTSVVFRDKLSPDHEFGGKGQHAQQVLLLTIFTILFLPFILQMYSWSVSVYCICIF